MYVYTNELYHYGILGMKWGVRRYQNYDGTRTAAGLRKEAKERGTLSTYLKNRRQDRKNYKAALKKTISSKEYRRASEVKRNAMEGKELIKYENARKKNGLTPEQKKKIAIALGVTAAVAVTAVVAYNLKNKHAQEVAGTILKAGTKLQVIEDTNTDDFNHIFYAAGGARDKAIYKGLYGFQKKVVGDDVYAHTVKANKDIKVAPRKAAIEAFNNLYSKDADFRKTVDANMEMFKQYPHLANLARKAETDKASKYDLFNIGLANHKIDPEELQKGMFANAEKLQDPSRINAAHDKFYNALKDKGYGAVIDRNDNQYSGFKSKSPYIVFDYQNVGKEAVKKVGGGELAVNYIAQDVIRNGKQYAAYGALGVGISALSNSSKKQTYINSQVSAYKKDHPNTKMTDAEIEKMIIDNTK